MKTTLFTILSVVILFGTCPLWGDVVELDLFSLGCPTEFDFDSLPWQSDFDLGTEFLEIDSVYIDWSGEITAGLAILYDNPGEPFPLDIGIGVAINSAPNWRHTTLWGGEDTYPAPEPFDCLSEISSGIMPWSELFDGQGIIKIQYLELGFGDFGGKYIEHGFVSLDRAILRVEGVIPEPASLLLLSLGGLLLRKKR